jgi:hypothetical protein
MGSVEGYVTVYESSDGASGDPRQTFWNFFVAPGNAPPRQVHTINERLADTMRLAIETNSRVRVSYEDQAPHTMSEARIQFDYTCEYVKVESCPPGEPTNICLTRRYCKCDPRQIPRDGQRRRRK